MTDSQVQMIIAAAIVLVVYVIIFITSKKEKPYKATGPLSMLTEFFEKLEKGPINESFLIVEVQGTGGQFIQFLNGKTDFLVDFPHNKKGFPNDAPRKEQFLNACRELGLPVLVENTTLIQASLAGNGKPLAENAVRLFCLTFAITPEHLMDYELIIG